MESNKTNTCFDCAFCLDIGGDASGIDTALCTLRYSDGEDTWVDANVGCKDHISYIDKVLSDLGRFLRCPKCLSDLILPVWVKTIKGYEFHFSCKECKLDSPVQDSLAKSLVMWHYGPDIS